MRVTSVIIAMVMVLSACGDESPSRRAQYVDPALATTTSTTTPEETSPWPAGLGETHQDWRVRIVDRVPHDPAAFTQGLEMTEFGLIESTGRRGESTLRLVNASSGTVTDALLLDDALFGEGITVSGDEIIQLTWEAGVALRYDAETFEPTGEFLYEGEGWGICASDSALWMSNGTAELTRRDPVTFEVIVSLTVRRGDDALSGLNELECINDHVVANVWKSDDIHVIDPATGQVVATIDATALSAEIGPSDDAAVLNGIADLGDGTLLLGGKLWPNYFVVEVILE